MQNRLLVCSMGFVWYDPEQLMAVIKHQGPFGGPYVEYIEQSLSEAKIIHTNGVLSMVDAICENYDIRAPDKLRFAALMHDNARCLPDDEQRILAETFPEPLVEIEKENRYHHAQAGAMRLVRDFNYSPDDVAVQAVAYHPSGEEPMTQTLGALMVADWTEPGRDWWGPVQELREAIGQKSLVELVKLLFKRKFFDDEGAVPERSVRGYEYLRRNGLQKR